MWHLGLRKNKQVVLLVVIFVVLGVLATQIALECDFLVCPTDPLYNPAVITHQE